MRKNTRRDKMWIEYTKLKNYRQYRDVSLKFGKPKDKKNFIVIQGANGSGKTNIVNAITWCLYGKEKHMGSKYAGLPMVNTLAAEELEDDEIIEVEIEIQLRDQDGKKINLKRNMSYKKKEGGGLIKIPHPIANSGDGSRLTMMREINRDMVDVEDPSYVLRYLIPESIEEYFFFDGERLDDYFKETTGTRIREAVFKISQVELLEKVIEHLEKRKNEFIKKEKNLGSEAQRINSQIELYEKSLESYKKQLEEHRKQKNLAEQKENEYTEKLRGSSAPDVKRLQNEREEIDKDLKGLEEEIKELEKSKSDYLMRISPQIFAYNALIKANVLISSREEAGDVPPKYKKNFIRSLLDDGKCICGTDISTDNKHRKRVEKLLEECDEITNISEELITLNVSIKSALEEIEDFPERRESYNRKLRKYEETRKNKSKRLKKISEGIRGIDTDKISMWEEKLQEYKRLKEDLIGKITRMEYRCEEAEKTIKKLGHDLEKELEKEEQLEETKNIIGFCNICLEQATKIKERIMREVRKEIEYKTKKQFFELIWKREEYKDVTIDEEYNISVQHQSGMEGIGTMSAGERQALALSFMAALNSVSGFDVPIIIDTPLGRLSKEPKNNIARKLPNYLKEKQVTLLVTDSEYSPEVREKLLERLIAEYRIDFRETSIGNVAEVANYE